MNQLITYVKSIYGLESPVTVVSASSHEHRYLDGDLKIEQQTFTYTFDNGVIIRYKSEWDVNVISAAICEECWINYQVIEDNNHSINPARKIFYNSCQETQWIEN